MIHLDGDMSLTNMLDGDMQITEAFDGIASVLQKVIEVDPYTGEYDVDPQFRVQSLATAEKYMARDVTVNAIRVVRTSNIHGGQTVVIG